MDYFEGINAIREQQNNYYAQLLEQQLDQNAIIQSQVKKTRDKFQKKVVNSSLIQSARKSHRKRPADIGMLNYL